MCIQRFILFFSHPWYYFARQFCAHICIFNVNINLYERMYRCKTFTSPSAEEQKKERERKNINIWIAWAASYTSDGKNQYPVLFDCSACIFFSSMYIYEYQRHCHLQYMSLLSPCRYSHAARVQQYVQHEPWYHFFFFFLLSICTFTTLGICTTINWITTAYIMHHTLLIEQKKISHKKQQINSRRNHSIIS